MNVGKVIERFDSREQRLLRLLLLLLGVAVVIVAWVGSYWMVDDAQTKVDGLRNAISEIGSSQAAIAKAEQRRQTIAQRYSLTAPPLAAFLDGVAKESGVEIPESQDRPVVPHGKRYEERAIRLQLRKVALGNLARFLEKIEQPGHPVVLSKLNIRKRLTEPDSFDVELVASAYDRKELPKTEAGSEGSHSAPDGSGEPVESDAAKEQP